MKKAFWGPVKNQLQFLAVDLLGPRKRHLIFPDHFEDFGRSSGRVPVFSLLLHVELLLRCFVHLCSDFFMSHLEFGIVLSSGLSDGCRGHVASSFHLLGSIEVFPNKQKA